MPTRTALSLAPPPPPRPNPCRRPEQPLDLECVGVWRAPPRLPVPPRGRWHWQLVTRAALPRLPPLTPPPPGSDPVHTMGRGGPSTRRAAPQVKLADVVPPSPTTLLSRPSDSLPLAVFFFSCPFCFVLLHARHTHTPRVDRTSGPSSSPPSGRGYICFSRVSGALCPPHRLT